MNQQPFRNYDGINPLKSQFLSSSGESEDGLLDEVLVEILPGSKWRKRDIAMAIVCVSDSRSCLLHDRPHPLPMLLFP